MSVCSPTLRERPAPAGAMEWNYAMALYLDDTATLEDLREAVTTLEDSGKITRRVFGAA